MQGFDRIFEPFLKQRDRWALWTPVAIGIGVGLYFSLPFEPELFAGFGVFAAMLVLTVILNRRESAGRWIFFVLVLIALGFVAGQVRTAFVKSPALEEKLGVTEVEGTVVDIDRLEKGAFRLVLEKPVIEKLPPDKTPHRVRISVRTKTPQPKTGDRVKLLAGLMPLSSPVSPGAFDFQRNAYFQRIGATGYALSQIDVVTEAKNRFSLEDFRQKVTDRIHAAVSDKESAAVTIALLIGERREISEAAWNDIRKSGLAHLLAISGLHIGIVTGFVFFILRALLALSERAALYWPIKKISAAMALLSAVVYTQVCGSPVPAERAVLMIAVVMLAVILDRDPFSLRLAAFAATVILLFAPEVMMGPSFQMSFAAVVSLIAFYEAFSKNWGRWARQAGFARRCGLWLLGSVLTTVIAGSATAVFSLYHFQQLSLWGSILANMIAVPLTVFVTMPFGFIGLLLAVFGGGGFFFWVAGQGNRIILDVAHYLADCAYSMAYLAAWPQAGFILVVLGMLWAVLWKGRLRLFGIIPVAAGLIVVYMMPQPDVLIADNGKIAATRNALGALAFSSSRQERFIREEWQRRDGKQAEKAIEVWPKPGEGEKNGVSCDWQGCIYQGHDFIVAFSGDRAALAEDCKTADVVVAMDFGVKESECKGKAVIDHWDLKDRGAYTLYFFPEGIKIVATNDLRGQRPWVLQRARKTSGFNSAGKGFSGDPVSSPARGEGE